MLPIVLLASYGCFVWFVARWLRRASLPDRCFLSQDVPDVPTVATIHDNDNIQSQHTKEKPTSSARDATL